MKDDSHELLNKKEAMLENLYDIKTTLSECTDSGYEDIEDVMYNEILALIDATKESGEKEDLLEIIAKAKVIENALDSWLSIHGVSNLELEWPKF